MLGVLTGQGLLTDLGTVAGALLAIGALLAAASRLRPFRWLWRNLVTEPVGEWFGAVIDHRLAPITEQFSNNGGSTARDAIDRIERRQDSIEERLQSLDDGQGDLATSVDAIRSERADEARECGERQRECDARQVHLNKRLERLDKGLASFLPILNEWRDSHPEMRPSDDDSAQT